MNVFLHLGLLSSSSSRDPRPDESLTVKLEKLWFLCRPPGRRRFLVSRGQEPSVVGTSQNQAGAVLLRAKGAVAPPGPQHGEPGAAGPELEASGCLGTADRGRRTGPRAQRGPVLPTGSLAPATGGAGQSWIAEGKPWKALGQALCSSLFCHQGSQPLPRVRVARLPLFEAKCQESLV